jgi:hypothetical protein
MDFITKPKLLKGVSVDSGPRIKKFKSTIRINGKLKHLGYYKTEQEAHDAYVKAKSELDSAQKDS